jgi:hypothetical protein
LLAVDAGCPLGGIDKLPKAPEGVLWIDRLRRGVLLQADVAILIQVDGGTVLGISAS